MAAVTFITAISIIFAVTLNRRRTFVGASRIVILMGLGVVIYSISILVLIALLTGPREWGVLFFVPMFGSALLAACALVGTIMALSAIA